MLFLVFFMIFFHFCFFAQGIDRRLSPLPPQFNFYLCRQLTTKYNALRYSVSMFFIHSFCYYSDGACIYIAGAGHIQEEETAEIVVS